MDDKRNTIQNIPEGDNRNTEVPPSAFPPQGTPGVPMPRRSNGMATASLVMGILSLLLFCCGGFPGIVFGALGLTFAFLSREDGRMFTTAKVGLGLGTGGLVLGLITIFCCIIALQSPVFQKEFKDQFNQYYSEYYNSYSDGSSSEGSSEFNIDDYLEQYYNNSTSGQSSHDF